MVDLNKDKSIDIKNDIDLSDINYNKNIHNNLYDNKKY